MSLYNFDIITKSRGKSSEEILNTSYIKNIIHLRNFQFPGINFMYPNIYLKIALKLCVSCNVTFL